MPGAFLGLCKLVIMPENWMPHVISFSIHHTYVLLLCSAIYDPDTIRTRLRELAFLNSTATIKFRATEAHSNGNTDWQVFHFSRGLADYMDFLNRDKEALHQPISISKTVSALATGGYPDILGPLYRTGFVQNTHQLAPAQLVSCLKLRMSGSLCLMPFVRCINLDPTCQVLPRHHSS